MVLSQFVPPFPSPLCPKVCSLRLHLHCCPADRFIRAIFLDPVLKCFFFLPPHLAGVPCCIKNIPCQTLVRTALESLSHALASHL